MFNILRMDLYKMFKSKSFYILNVALLVIALSMALLMKFTLTMDFEKGQQSNLSYNRNEEMLSTNDPSVTEEEYNSMQAEIIDTMTVNEFIVFQYSEFLISILLVIFIALFICSESDTGFIKNIIPLKNSRINLLISKNIIVIFFIIIQGIIGFIASIISNLIVSGKVNILDFKELVIYLGIQMLLRIAFGSLLILFAYLFKSKSASMSVGILLSVNIHGLFLDMLNRVVSISNLNLSKLSIIGNVSIVRFDHDDYQRVIIISIVYFILYNIITTIRVNKMEIN